MKRMKAFAHVAVSVFLVMAIGPLRAQLVIDTDLTPPEIAQNLVGDGVEINNVNVVAADSAFAYYFATGTEIGTSDGLLLSTGNVINAIGPNDETGLPELIGGVCQNCDFYDNEFPGSDLLDAAQDRNTFDAALFEFDVVPQGDSLKFKYTFASEEYNEWVGSPFNDVFGFYISGPGVGTDVPIAIVPGTPSTPVAINTINSILPEAFPEFYVSNQNPGGQFIQYDGFTQNLEASVGNLIPCETYHLTLVIGDGTDRLYDSAVFVEKIESNPVTVLTATAGGIDTMIEGCNDGSISFVRPEVSDQAQVVTFWIGGTATDGVDFLPQIGTGTPGDPLTIIIPPNESTATIDISTIEDGIDEGSEYLTIYLANPLCDNGLQDSVNFFINDSLEVSISPPESTVCFGDCVDLVGDAVTGGSSTFEWSPTDFITDPDVLSIEVCPENDVEYTLTSQVSECIATATSNITVTQIDLELSTEPVNCADVNFGEISLTVNNATPPLDFQWTGPNGYTSTDQNPSGLETGTYCVTVTDANGCIGTECIDVIESDVLEVDEITLSDYTCFPISCAGECDGSITLAITGGVEPYEIVWDDDQSQTGLTATDLCAGSYNATITDGAGCTITETITLEEPEPLDIELVGTVDVLCNGEETGVATVTSTGGCTPYFYSWSHDPDLSAPVADDLPSGTFTVTVSDVNGCESDDLVTIEIGEPGEPISVSSTVGIYPNGFNVSCPEGNDGFIDITIEGGIPDYSVQWFDGPLFLSADPTGISDLECGTYTIVVTDSNECVYTEDIEILCPPPFEISSVITPNPCGDPNAGLGAIDVTVSGGDPDYDYSWTGPDGFTAITEDITGLNSGSYELTVTDSQGCTFTFPIIPVTSSDDIDVNGTVTNVSCNEECDGAIDIEISGGTPPFNITWTGPDGFTSDQEDINLLCGGTYGLFITDFAGCEFASSFEVIEPDEIDIDVLELTPPFCAGVPDGSIEVSASGGSGMLSYEWLPSTDIEEPGPDYPGAIGETSIENLWGGSYTIVVTDENGCSADSTLILNAPPGFEINVETTEFIEGDSLWQLACAGDSDGQISVSIIGGTPDCDLFDPFCYLYDWTQGADIGANNPASPTLTDLGEGTYIVVAEDANGCIVTTDIPMTAPDILSSSPFSEDPLCFGDSTGTITPNVTGGNGDTDAYVYDWTSGDIGDNEPDATTLTDLPAGFYQLEVTDSFGCSEVVLSTTLFNPPAIGISIEEINPVSCFDYSDGSILVSALGGTSSDGTLDYNWTGPNGFTFSGTNPTGLEAGTYTLTVTDDNLCAESIDVTLDDPDLFDLNITVPMIDDAPFTLPCNGDESGAIIATIEGGVPEFDIQWTLDGMDFSEELTIDSLGAGEYCLTVVDSLDCISDTCYTITEPDEALLISSNVLEYGNGFNVSCFDLCDGNIELTVTGGVAPYSYVWRDENDEEVDFDQVLEDACAGDYEVVVQDANGCTETLSFELTEPDEILVDIEVSEYEEGFNVSCAGAEDGSITATASGGAGGPYTYEWTGDIETSGSEIEGLSGGSYILVVTDVEECSSSQVITNLLEPDSIDFNPIISNPLCNGDSNGSIDANISGGSGVYTITWDGLADTDELIESLEAGSYTINVTDNNNCTGSETFVLSDPDLLEASGQSVAATCGDANGSIDLTLSGGTGDYNIEWTGPSGIANDVEDPTELLAGTYSASITDENGCNTSVEVIVDGPEAIELDLILSNPTCFNDGTGAIDLSISNGTPEYTILWTLDGEEFSSLEDINSLSGGFYDVLVTDSEGCSETATGQIIEPDPLDIEFTVSEYDNGYNVSSVNGTDGSITTDVSGGTPEYTYQWQGPTEIEDGETAPTDLSAGEYTLIVTDVNDCVLAIEITLTGPEELQLPTGITPNGDGFNDFYVILGLDQYPDNVLKIYNRWGNIVFEVNDYDNDWDGTNNDGEALPDGTYYVIFESPDKTLNNFVDLRR